MWMRIDVDVNEMKMLIEAEGCGSGEFNSIEDFGYIR